MPFSAHFTGRRDSATTAAMRAPYHCHRQPRSALCFALCRCVAVALLCCCSAVALGAASGAAAGGAVLPAAARAQASLTPTASPVPESASSNSADSTTRSASNSALMLSPFAPAAAIVLDVVCRRPGAAAVLRALEAQAQAASPSPSQLPAGVSWFEGRADVHVAYPMKRRLKLALAAQGNAQAAAVGGRNGTGTTDDSPPAPPVNSNATGSNNTLHTDADADSGDGGNWTSAQQLPLPPDPADSAAALLSPVRHGLLTEQGGQPVNGSGPEPASSLTGRPFMAHVLPGTEAAASRRYVLSAMGAPIRGLLVEPEAVALAAATLAAGVAASNRSKSVDANQTRGHGAAGKAGQEVKAAVVPHRQLLAGSESESSLQHGRQLAAGALRCGNPLFLSTVPQGMPLLLVAPELLPPCTRSDATDSESDSEQDAEADDATGSDANDDEAASATPANASDASGGGHRGSAGAAKGNSQARGGSLSGGNSNNTASARAGPTRAAPQAASAGNSKRPSTVTVCDVPALKRRAGSGKPASGAANASGATADSSRFSSRAAAMRALNDEFTRSAAAARSQASSALAAAAGPGDHSKSEPSSDDQSDDEAGPDSEPASGDLDSSSPAAALANDDAGSLSSLAASPHSATQRRLTQPRSLPVHVQRQLYILPSVSRGARTLLAVKFRFIGQSSAVLASSVEMQTLTSTAASELARASFGAATFAVTLPSASVQLSSTTPVCSPDLGLLERDGRAAAKAQLGIDSAAYQHFVMLLPLCSNYAWSGMANAPGSWAAVNGADSTLVRTLLHELGHSLGLLHASSLDAVTGAWSEYADPSDLMSSCDDYGCNNYRQRDYGGGFKTDMGWLPEGRVRTFGPLVASLGDDAAGSETTGNAAAMPATVALAALDSGDLSRGGGASSPLALRFRHPLSQQGAAFGSRYIYASFRARSAAAPNGLTLADVPHGAYTAGNSRLIDTTPFTPSIDDAAVDAGQAVVVTAADGQYLLEPQRSMRTPSGSADPRDSLLRVRVSKLQRGGCNSSSTAGTSAAALKVLPPQGLGCFSATCQSSPSDATLLRLPSTCAAGASPSGSAAAWVPIREAGVGYPAVFAVNLPGVTDCSDAVTGAGSCSSSAGAAAPGQGGVFVTARLCAPSVSGSGLAASAVASFNLSLAVFREAPTAATLAGAAIDRGSADDTALPVLVTSSSSSNSVSAAWDNTCRIVTFGLTADAGPRYVAALVQAPTGRATAGQAVVLSLSCSSPAAVAASAASLSAVLSFGNSYFSGTYVVDSDKPSFNGALQWVLPGRFRIRYASGAWTLWTWDASGYYVTQPAPMASDGVTPMRDLSRLGSVFGVLSFAFAPRCPAHAFLIRGNASSGRPATCAFCPLHAASRGDGAVASAGDSISAVCSCQAGYILQEQPGSGKPAVCVACPAGMYKEGPGNGDGIDGTAGCLDCPFGFTSSAGSATCYMPAPATTSSSGVSVSAASAGGLPALCTRYSIAGWTAGWNGVYTLDTTTQGSSTVRDGWGEGRVIYRLTGSVPQRYLVGIGSFSAWYFTQDREAASWAIVISSARPPQAWTAADEWSAASWTGPSSSSGTSYASASAVCLCSAYGRTTVEGSESESAARCSCPAGQAANTSIGRCIDAVTPPCPPGFAVAPGGGCADINECAAGNGGCSHTCVNTIGGRTCECPAGQGMGLDSATRTTCGVCPDDQLPDPDPAAGGVCVPCPASPAGLRRTAAGSSCGCPFGSVLVGNASASSSSSSSTESGLACVRPSDVYLDVWSRIAGSTARLPFDAQGGYDLTSGSAPFRGRFAACALSPQAAAAFAHHVSGYGVNRTGMRASAWQLVSQLPGARPPPAPLFLVHEPRSVPVSDASGSGRAGVGSSSSGTWSIYAGTGASELGPAGHGTPRYAYVAVQSLNVSSAWPAAVTAGGGSGSFLTATAGMLPAGIQQWQVFTPHPSGFAPAWLRMAVASTGAAVEARLPLCGSMTLAAADAATSMSLAGASTLGSGPGSLPSSQPSTNGAAGASALPVAPGNPYPYPYPTLLPVPSPSPSMSPLQPGGWASESAAPAAATASVTPAAPLGRRTSALVRVDLLWAANVTIATDAAAAAAAALGGANVNASAFAAQLCAAVADQVVHSATSIAALSPNASSACAAVSALAALAGSGSATGSGDCSSLRRLRPSHWQGTAKLRLPADRQVLATELSRSGSREADAEAEAEAEAAQPTRMGSVGDLRRRLGLANNASSAPPAGWKFQLQFTDTIMVTDAATLSLLEPLQRGIPMQAVSAQAFPAQIAAVSRLLQLRGADLLHFALHSMNASAAAPSALAGNASALPAAGAAANVTAWGALAGDGSLQLEAAVAPIQVDAVVLEETRAAVAVPPGSSKPWVAIALGVAGGGAVVIAIVLGIFATIQTFRSR